MAVKDRGPRVDDVTGKLGHVQTRYRAITREVAQARLQAGGRVNIQEGTARVA